MKADEPQIRVQDLTVGYGSAIVQRDVEFTVNRGEIFIIMGTSGCGKSTLMRCIVGLVAPIRGRILYEGESFWEADAARREAIMRRFGVLYQSGALWSSMTLAENVALPLTEFTRLDERRARDIAALKLALVGLAGFEDYYPAEISGGMRRRAGIARAMALDPDILFLDEPSAGLDPITSRMLDELILHLRDSLETTVVVVTHELASILDIGDNAVFLDTETKTMLARGHPRSLRDESDVDKVRRFLTRSSA